MATDVSSDARYANAGGNDGCGRAPDARDTVSSAPMLRLHLVEEEDASFEECLSALCGLGLKAEEAANIVEACNGDLERVRELYDIDWSRNA